MKIRIFIDVDGKLDFVYTKLTRDEAILRPDEIVYRVEPIYMEDSGAEDKFQECQQEIYPGWKEVYPDGS